MKHTKQIEGRIIQIGVVLYWTLFWFLNFIDKLITEPTYIWAGRNRLAQFMDYFASIGVDDPRIPHAVFVKTTVAELIAFVLCAGALYFLLKKKNEKAHAWFFWGTLVGLVIFSFFSIGDQIFGDRVELWEHTQYWIALIVSWAAYIYFPKK